MKSELVRYGELDLDQIRAWRNWQRATLAYASPFLHPRFTDAVSSVRQDARVLIVEDDGDVVGFWPMHVRPGGLARPIGAPLSDHTGPICDPNLAVRGGFDAALALRQVGLRALSFTGLVDPHCLFSSAVTQTQPSHVAEFGAGGGEGFLAEQQNLYSKRFKGLRRNERIIARDFGTARFILDDNRPESLSRLLMLKSAQFASTGKHDVFSPNWVRKLFDRLNAIQDPEFRSIVSTFEIEGELAAAEFNLIAGSSLASWVVAYDPKFAAGSPGNLIVQHIVAQIGQLGVNRIDFGPGHDHYKKYFANAEIPISEGLIEVSGHAPSLGAMVRGLVSAAERAPLGAVARVSGKVRRRFEQIVAVEPTLSGRMHGIMGALKAYRLKDGASPTLAEAAD